MLVFLRVGLLAVALVASLVTPQLAARGQRNDGSQTKYPGQTSAQTDDEVERVDVDLTNVLLNVVDKNRRFVTSLKREDLRVLEDNVPQEIFTFQRETDLPLSLAILIDTSASQEGVMPDEREAATAFLDAVLRPERDAAAIVSFTGITRFEQPLTRDRDSLARAIASVKVLYSFNSPECIGDDIPEDIRVRCLTGIWDAIYITIRESLAHTLPSTRRAIILLSDGDETLKRTPIYRAVEYAVEHNTAVYAIGIRDRAFKGGGELRKDFLRQISEETGGRAFYPRNRQELDAAFAQINQELRSQYLVAYSPSNKKRDGTFRRVRIEIANPALRKEKLRLQYRQGYVSRTEPPVRVSND